MKEVKCTKQEGMKESPFGTQMYWDTGLAFDAVHMAEFEAAKHTMNTTTNPIEKIAMIKRITEILADAMRSLKFLPPNQDGTQVTFAKDGRILINADHFWLLDDDDIKEDEEEILDAS